MPLDVMIVATPPAPQTMFHWDLPLPVMSPLGPLDGGAALPLSLAPAVLAVDEETEEDDDAPEPEIIPPTEPLETTSDFDEDDFDDDFDDDFEEEFEDDEFDSEVTPEDLESGEDDEDSFDDD
jgi:hypothetical protein